MSSKVNELIVSFFGNGYVTYLDAEISDYIYQRRKVSQQEFIDILHQKGYSIKNITKELDRQCYASTLRYILSEDAYVSVDIGRHLWTDILRRIHDQQSMVGGKLKITTSDVKLDIYRTDFQSLKFKKVIKHLGLHQAPVMRWTKQSKRKEALDYLDLLMDLITPRTHHDEADLKTVLQAIQYANKNKSKKTTWAWLITHPVMRLELTSPRETVAKTVFSLSKGPVDWKGKLVSLFELKESTGLSHQEIEESVEYFEEQGIFRKINDSLTPTGQGYVLVQYAFRSHHSITFAVVRVDKEYYQLEISAPHLPGFDITGVLEENGGKRHSEFGTPVVFPEREKSEVIKLLNTIVGSGFV